MAALNKQYTTKFSFQIIFSQQKIFVESYSRYNAIKTYLKTFIDGIEKVLDKKEIKKINIFLFKKSSTPNTNVVNK